MERVELTERMAAAAAEAERSGLLEYVRHQFEIQAFALFMGGNGDRVAMKRARETMDAGNLVIGVIRAAGDL